MVDFCQHELSTKLRLVTSFACNSFGHNSAQLRTILQRREFSSTMDGISHRRVRFAGLSQELGYIGL